MKTLYEKYKLIQKNIFLNYLKELIRAYYMGLN